MAKDKLIGAVVMVLGVLIGVLYTLGSIVDLGLITLGNLANGIDLTSAWLTVDLLDWRLFVVGPIWLIVVLIAFIAVWIGWSMLTTPAPVPLEVS